MIGPAAFCKQPIEPTESVSRMLVNLSSIPLQREQPEGDGTAEISLMNSCASSIQWRFSKITTSSCLRLSRVISVLSASSVRRSLTGASIVERGRWRPTDSPRGLGFA